MLINQLPEWFKNGRIVLSSAQNSKKTHIRSGQQRMSWLDSIADFTDINLSKLQEKEMATHSTIHDWKILWTEEPGRLQSMESQGPDLTEWLTHYHHWEIVKDKKDWHAAVHGTPKSQTCLSNWKATTNSGLFICMWELLLRYLLYWLGVQLSFRYISPVFPKRWPSVYRF